MDELIKVLGGQAPSGSNDIAGALSGLVGGEGGLQNLVGQLSSNGLGEQISSWVNTGPNKSVDPAQLQQALGEEQVNKLASQSGLPVAQLMPLVAAALPSIVDALTPDQRGRSRDDRAGPRGTRSQARHRQLSVAEPEPGSRRLRSSKVTRPRAGV